MVRCAVPLLWLLVVGAAGALAGQARLPDMLARGHTPCEVHPETAEATADLWVDARVALESAAEGDPNAPTLLVAQWHRRLSSQLRLQWERRDTGRVRTRQPFAHPTPGNLERAGYIQSARDGFTYYGPGADLLLSERFLRRHCFHRELGTGGREGLIGLAFVPLPTRQAPDVTGVLWIDPVQHLLRHLDYTWTDPPLDAAAPALQGRTDFVRLADGGWIVQRWNMRLPRPSDAPGTGYGGYTDQGGEVLAVGRRSRSAP